ncbi:UNVERIFIED_CONTAM: oligomeric, coiled-coil, peripheral membrane protein [Siphonaria sp. JEL0065]|nr:oligomeric, coiled-coil, peripheral membrane protein [Siphonaria sp. JEL0065]
MISKQSTKDITDASRVAANENDDESKFLSDYVPEEKLLLWADKCRIGHEEFVKKTMALSETVKSLKTGTEMEINNGLDVDFESLTSHASSAQSNLSNLRQTLQLLVRDFTRVQSILQDLRIRSNTDLSSSTYNHQPLEQTLTALHHLQEIHTQEYIPALTATATHIQTTLLQNLITSKIHSTSVLRSRLRSISHLQTLLSNTVAPGIARLNQNIGSMSQAFGQLLHVHRMPAAWGAVVVEVVRRREFVRVLVNRAEAIASGFGKVGELEKKRRETFAGEIGKYLPRFGEKGKMLVPGLEEEGVPKVEVRVVKGADLLPKIGRADVYDFEQFISQIRAAMTDVDPSSSTVPSTNQTLTSSHTSSAGNPADSISKLQATMTKMIPQIDAVSAEFDRQIAKGGGASDRVAKLEEENARLKAELGALRGGGGSLVRNNNMMGNVGSPVTVGASPSTSAPTSTRKSMSAKAMSAGTFDGDWARAEETIKVCWSFFVATNVKAIKQAYENRIRTLEDLLQRSYHMEKSNLNNSTTGASAFPTDQAALLQLQTENSTLRTRLAFLESQFSTTSTSLQNTEVKLKEVLAEREKSKTVFESDRGILQSRCTELENNVVQLRHQLAEKDKEGRVVVAEVERCAGFVREVYELLDDCAGAFKIRGQDSIPDGTSDHPLSAHYSASYPQNQPTRNSSTASSLAGKYQSPTSPSAGLMAIVNAATSFGSTNNSNGLRNYNSTNPLLLAHQQQQAAAAPVLAILSTLRTDEREIRRRLRELQDDIRCQALELIGLQDEMAAMGAASSQHYSGDGTTGTGDLSPAFGSSIGGGGVGPTSLSVTAAAGDAFSPHTEQSRSGISIGNAIGGANGTNSGRVGHSLATSIPILEELHASKREIQRLESVVEELSTALENTKTELVELTTKYALDSEEAPQRKAQVIQLTEAVSRLSSEKEEWMESNEQAWMKMERLKGALETVQQEKGGVEKRLEEVSREFEALQVVHSKIDAEWRVRSSELTQNVLSMEAHVKALNAKLANTEDSCAAKLNEAEAVQFDLNKTIAALQVSVNGLEMRIKTAESERSTSDAAARQKDVEISRLEDTCEKFRVAVGKEKGKVIKLKEKVEDWSVVCKMAMECLTQRFEALGNMGEALVEMDVFVDRFVQETLGLQATLSSLASQEENPLQLKQSDLTSFKLSLNQMSSSLSNSATGGGLDHDFSAESKLPALELRETYLNMIHLIDSIDLGGWSDAVIRSCHNWKEVIMTQSLRRAMVRETKISFSNFREGDLALFLPTRNPKTWAAFNVNAPHYFLSISSADAHFPTQIKTKDWILGVITQIESRQAAKNPDEKGPTQHEGNPFGLAVGSKYFWCTAVPLGK